MKTNPKPAHSESKPTVAFPDQAALSRRHLRFGWWSLLVFLSLGILLESLHGFKVGWYLNVANETRRLMLTLAHAHGTLLALINLGFAATLPILPSENFRRRNFAGSCLLAASVLVPGGFFLGGVTFHAGDPGLGIFLLPPGALLLVVAVFLTARAVKPGSELRFGSMAKKS